MMYIEIDDLVANAFIPYLEETGRRTLSLRKIHTFGKKVVKYLNEKGESTCLRLSRDLTDHFFYHYSDLFSLIDTTEGYAVHLINEDITSIDLIHQFSGYLSLPVLLAFKVPENIQVLLDK